MASLTIQQPATYSGRTLDNTLFQRVPTDLRYVNSRYQTFLPLNSIGDGSVDRIIFNIPSLASASTYDFSSLLLEMSVTIVDKDNNLPGSDIRIANICGAHSFFSDIKYYLNDVLINPNSGNYPFKSYLKNLLSFPSEYKKTVLSLESYSEDTAHKMQSVGEDNEGFTKRLKEYANLDQYDNVLNYKQENAHFLFNLSPDLQAEIINGVAIRIELTPSNPDFCLFGKKVVNQAQVVDNLETSVQYYEDISGYKFLIKNISLHVLCHDLRSEVYEQIQQNLKKEPISISFRRFDLVPYIINKGVETYISDVLFPSSQMIPSRAFFFLIPSEYFTGNLSANPYDFQLKVVDAKIKKIQITLGGQEIDGLLSDKSFSKIAFYRLQKLLGLMDSGFCTGIDYDMFIGGFGIYVIDFSTSLASAQQFILPSIKTGHARASILFDKVTPASYHLLSLLEYPSNLSISIGAQGRVVQVITYIYIIPEYNLYVLHLISIFQSNYFT